MSEIKILEKRVMRRVYLAWLFRRLVGKTALRLWISVFIIAQLASRVSLVDVWTNILSVRGWVGYYYFWQSAFAQTELTIQLLATVLLALAFWAVKDGFAVLFRRRFFFNPF